MAKWKNRTCTSCGKIEHTASRSPLCAECFINGKKQQKINEELAQLTGLGYEIIGDPAITSTGHRQYRLVPPCCGREFTPTFSNILKQLNLGTKLPCRWCGGERRISTAMKGYIERYGAEYDETELKNYSLKVRRLSETTYRAYRHIINPKNLPRGRTRGSHHLDHRVPVIWCFKNGVSPEVAAGLNNLQLIPMEENLAKDRKLLSNEEAHQLLSTSSVEATIRSQVPNWKGDVVTDVASVWKTDRVTVREGEYLKRPEAVISRLKHSTGESSRKIGARSLVLQEVPVAEEREFLSRWHIQGWASSRRALGLYLADELIALMTFTVPRYRQAEAEHELLRYAVKGGTTVQGGASRLFTEWKRTTQATAIISYSLNRWGDGELYRKLGFEKKGSSSSPLYIWPDGKIRSWRASVLKARRDGVDLKTLKKIQDPGSSTWILRFDRARESSSL